MRVAVVAGDPSFMPGVAAEDELGRDSKIERRPAPRVALVHPAGRPESAVARAFFGLVATPPAEAGHAPGAHAGRPGA